MMSIKRFPKKGVLTGTLAGISYEIGMPVWLVRFLFIASLFVYYPLVIAAYVLMALISKRVVNLPADFNEKTK